MINRIWAMTSLGLFLAVSLVFSQAGSVEAFRIAVTGKAAPTLSLIGTDKKRVSFPPAGSRAAVLFWRPDQKFSMQALADFDALSSIYKKRGISFWAVGVAGTTRSDARKAASKLKLRLSLYVDEHHQAKDAYGIVVLPSTGIVGADGTLQFYLPTRNSNYKAILDARIRLTLGEIDGAKYVARLRKLGESVEATNQVREHIKAGKRLLRAGQAVEAVRQLETAVAAQPNLMEGQLELGYARLETGDPAGARVAFELVLRENPNSPRGRVGLGIAMLRTGKRKEGMALLKEAIQLNPDPVMAYFALGEAYEAMGDYSAALKNYRWAVQKLKQGRR